ncbi:MAG TPA: outer membrane lipoprotein-sorting protein [Verrucomicrobiae bacterium]|jgi:hypothetical protein
MEIAPIRNRIARARRPCHYPFIFALSFCLFASTLFAQKQNEISQPTVLPPERAAKEGKALVDEILAQKPAQNTTNTGVLTIRTKIARTQIPVRFEVFATETNWCSRYDANNTDVVVIHDGADANEYRLKTSDGKVTALSGNQAAATPFVGSDFSIADLGLEFFHWPEQHLIKKEMKRSRSCRVLESINPHPLPGGYSRVKSWIDAESDGIVYAEAYDAGGKLLKEFIPKHFEKVNGQWQLREMEIDNDQTDSSTRVDFDLSH